MLAMLPPLRPDELLPYSLMARYNNYFGFPENTDLIHAFYGTTKFYPCLPYSRGFNALINNLPPGHSYTVDELINKHTLYPWINAFSTPDRRQQCMDYFLTLSFEQDTTTRFLANGIGPTLKYLRYCPECARQDYVAYGEIHWRRSFQVPGVNVCLDHHVFLEESLITYPRSMHARHYQLLPTTALNLSPRPVNPRKQADKILLIIASDVRRFMTGPVLLPSKGSMANQYRFRAEELKIKTYAHKLKHVAKQLSILMGMFYPPDLLRQLNRKLTPQDREARIYNWLKSADRARAPLYHLMLIRAMGYSAEDFMSASSAKPHHTDEKFPCLNPFCQHYKQFCLTAGQLTTSVVDDLPRHVFECECGFAYTQKAGKWDFDVYQWDEVQRYGPVWLRAFLELWHDSTYSLEDLATKCHMTVAEVNAAIYVLRISSVNRLQQIACQDADWMKLLG